MMRFYPGLSLSELKAMDPIERQGLLLNINRLRARERLEHQDDISIAHAEDAKDIRMELAEVAFADDEESLARFAAALSTKG